MAMVKDFKTDTDGDLFISSGDLAIFESDSQSIVDIITSNNGDWKEYPLCGVGIDNYINSNSSQQFLTNDIKTQLTNDGFGNVDVIYDNNNSLNFTIDAVRS
jgi:hypothetical protein